MPARDFNVLLYTHPSGAPSEEEWKILLKDNNDMVETNIVLATIAFILGSIQYQIRIRLSDIKEDILRTMRHYSGRGGRDSLSLVESIRLMRYRLAQKNLPAGEAAEYKNCIQEYDNMQLLMKVTGIFIPAGALFLYWCTKYISV